MTMMHAPPHPGTTLQDEVLLPLGLSVTAAAKQFGITHEALSHVLDGKAAISPDLALRLEQAGVSTARAWLAMQANHDLWCAKQNPGF
jgi:addiction module HigA family antidote